MNYGQAQAQGITYKAWRYVCEQEEIEREQDDPTESADYVTHEDRFDSRDEEEAIFDRACERAPLPYSDDEDDEFFTALTDPNSRQIFPGEDPDSICMCPACSAMRAKYEHDVALARAVLHCPEPIPEETEMVDAALKSPIARWIQGQLAMERWAS